MFINLFLIRKFLCQKVSFFINEETYLSIKNLQNYLMTTILIQPRRYFRRTYICVEMNRNVMMFEESYIFGINDGLTLWEERKIRDNLDASSLKHLVMWLPWKTFRERISSKITFRALKVSGHLFCIFQLNETWAKNYVDTILIFFSKRNYVQIKDFDIWNFWDDLLNMSHRNTNFRFE